jgi:tetratricopeptide (TPR) repeat protein
MTAGGNIRLPLALAVVAARAATRPAFPLVRFAVELDATRRGLDAFDDGDPATDVRAVFSWSYRCLSLPAARLFRQLGLHCGPDVSAAAAASLAGRPRRETDRALAELSRAHLVEEHRPDRYACHDLLRAYAAELASVEETEEQRRTAVCRALDHYLQTGYAAAQLIEPYRHRIDPVPPRPGVTPEPFTGAAPALAWFAGEQRVLVAAVRQAAGVGFDAHAWQLAWILAGFLDRQANWRDLADTQALAVAAARRQGDRFGQAQAHRLLGLVHARQGRHEEAQAQHRCAMDLFGALGDYVGLAFVHHSLAELSDARHHPEQALHHALRSLDLFRTAGYQAGVVNILNTVGWCHAQLGDYRRALTYCQEALRLLRDRGDESNEASTWDSLAYVHQRLEHHEEAVYCYRRAVELFRKIGDRYGEAIGIRALGDAHDASGDPAAARTAWQQALNILDRLGHPDAAAVRARIASVIT